MSVTTCGLEGCEYDHQRFPTTEHSWSDSTTARTAGEGPHTVMVFAVVDERDRRLDEVCLAVVPEGVVEPSAEVYMTTAEAERLRDLIGSAIRRIAAFRPGVAR